MYCMNRIGLYSLLLVGQTAGLNLRASAVSYIPTDCHEFDTVEKYQSVRAQELGKGQGNIDFSRLKRAQACMCLTVGTYRLATIDEDVCERKTRQEWLNAANVNKPLH